MYAAVDHSNVLGYLSDRFAPLVVMLFGWFAVLLVAHFANPTISAHR